MKFALHSGDGPGHRHNIVPGAALLLALLWLGGCRQIPQAPQPEPESVPTSSSVQANPVQPPAKQISEPESLPQEITRTGPVAEIVRPGTPMPPAPISVVPPSTGVRSPLAFEPQGSSQARWIPASQRPAWLKECLSSAQLDKPAKIQRTVMPQYPEKLLESDVQGRVVVLFQVSESGQLGNYLVQPGAHPALVKPSVQALRQWKFSPPTRQGKPVSVCLVQAFRYQLEE